MTFASHPTPAYRRGRLGALSLFFVLLLIFTGCGPFAQKRELPPEQPLNIRQTLDVCALLPHQQLKKSEPDVTFGQGRRRLSYDHCFFDLGAGKVWVTLADARDNLPERVLEVDEDEMTTHEVTGGRVLTEATGQLRCHTYVISDSGLILHVTAYSMTGVAPEPLCHFIQVISKTALASLANQVPTIDWPQDSLARTDLCAVSKKNGLISRLGMKGKMTAHDDHRECEVNFATDSKPFEAAELKVALYGTLNADREDDPRTNSVKVAGRDATLFARTGIACQLLIPMGTNPQLQKLLGKKAVESLFIDATPNADAGTDCTELVTAVEPLVKSLDR